MSSTQEAEILRYLGAVAMEGRTTDEADALGRASPLVARYKIEYLPSVHVPSTSRSELKHLRCFVVICLCFAMPSSINASSPAAFQGAKPAVSKPSLAPPDIIDIRGEHVEINLKDQIISQFNPEDGPRKLPTLLLYNERGLQLFEDVC